MPRSEAPEGETPTADPAPQAAPTSLVGATYPTVQVKANVAVRGLAAQSTGEVPDDDETIALVAAGLLERV